MKSSLLGHRPNTSLKLVRTFIAQDYLVNYLLTNLYSQTRTSSWPYRWGVSA
jgi:hypothetical protein